MLHLRRGLARLTLVTVLLSIPIPQLWAFTVSSGNSFFAQGTRKRSPPLPALGLFSASERSKDHTVPHQPSRPLLGRAGSTTVVTWHPPKARCQVADDRLKRQAERKTEREQARSSTSSQRHGKPRRRIRTYIV